MGSVASPLVSLGDLMLCTSAVMVAGAVVCQLFTLPLCEEVKQEGMRDEHTTI